LATEATEAYEALQLSVIGHGCPPVADFGRVDCPGFPFMAVKGTSEILNVCCCAATAQPRRAHRCGRSAPPAAESLRDSNRFAPAQHGLVPLAPATNHPSRGADRWHTSALSQSQLPRAAASAPWESIYNAALAVVMPAETRRCSYRLASKALGRCLALLSRCVRWRDRLPPMPARSAAKALCQSGSAHRIVPVDRSSGSRSKTQRHRP